MDSSNLSNFYETVIVGAGPAGLSVLYTLMNTKENNYCVKEKVLLIDLGKDIDSRQREDAVDCTMGLGGAGLYSDGKFSFYPCGTKVWNLKDKTLLVRSYDMLSKLFLDAIGLQIPACEILKENSSRDNEAIKNEKNNKNNGINVNKGENTANFGLKEYPSFYLSFEERKELILKMCSQANEQGILLFSHELKKIEKESNGYYNITIENSKKSQLMIRCKNLVLAGGKYFPIILKKLLPKCPQIFHRIEYGARLQAKNSIFSRLFPQDFHSKNLIDPKWIFYHKEQMIEYRTFCLCVNGETVLCKYFDGLITSFSGRADCPLPTSLTNFGLNIIIRDKNSINTNKNHNNINESNNNNQDNNTCNNNDNENFITKNIPFEKSLKEIIEINGKGLFSFQKAEDLFVDACRILIKQFKIEEVDEIKVIGPTFEGVGDYPLLNEDLAIEGENIYVIGDACGLFRGIIPSMMSGLYIGLKLRENKN